MKKIRWGLLSTARINRRVIPAIRASERGELTAVASRTEETAAAYAQEWHIPHAFPTYEAMLASDQVDAVYISLPNHLHTAWTINALEAGKHVLCEKPFALSLSDVDAMTAASQKQERVLMEAFMYRFHPQMKVVGDWVRGGHLGQITYVSSRFSFMLTHENDVRLVPEWGGGCLWDVGVYPVSLAQYIYGEPPVRVSAQQVLGETEVDVSFAGQMLYANGGMAHISSSFRTPFQQHALIVGSKGHLHIERPFNVLESRPFVVTFYDDQDKATTLPFADEYLYNGEIEAMHDAILEGASPLLTLDQTRSHVGTVLALYESAREGHPVELTDE